MNQKYGSALGSRSYQKERDAQRGSMVGNALPFIADDIALLSFGSKMYFGENKVKDLIKDHTTASGVYKSIRRLESRLPMFRIPLRASQFGDLLSPFVDEKSTNWKYDIHEIFDKSGKTLKEEAAPWVTSKEVKSISKKLGMDPKDTVPKFLKELDISTVAGHDAFTSDGSKARGFDSFEFVKNKDSKLYGKIYGKKNYVDAQGRKQVFQTALSEDLFLMERPSTKGGQISYFYEATKRQLHLKEAWGDDHWFMKGLNKNFNLSDKMNDRVKKIGGAVSGIGGSFLEEHVRAMNRFLKEPIPFLNKLLDLEVRTGANLENALSKQITGSLGDLGKLFAPIVQTEHLQVPQMEELGRLPRFLRPYVTSDYWSKTPGRMLTALSAKGAMIVKGVPTALMAASYTRRKITEIDGGLAGRAVSGGMFALGGLGVGSLVKSGYMRAGLTKTQAIGAAAGLVAGVLPAFDKGLGAGVGAIYSKANIISSQVWGLVGGSESLKRQEDLFAGITHPATAFGFGMLGGFMGFINKEIGSTKKIFGVDELLKKEGFQNKIQPFLSEFFGKDSLDEIFKISQEEITETGSSFGKINERIKGLSGTQHIDDAISFKIGASGIESIDPLIDAAKARAESGAAKVSGFGQSVPANRQLLGLAVEYGKQEPLGVVFQTREASRILREGLQRTSEGGVLAPKSFTGVLAGFVNEFMERNPDSAISQRIRTEGGFEELSSKLQTLSDEIIGLQHKSAERIRIDSSGVSGMKKVFEQTKSFLKNPQHSFSKGFVKGILGFTALSVGAAAVANLGSGNLNPIGLIPGWMIRLTGGSESAKETKEIMTGEKEVGIRKGRFWLLGQSPWEGTKTSYYRPHAAVLAQSDARDNALYGSFEERVEYEPLLHPLKFLLSDDFKYHREERLSYMSPTPLTGEAFKDVPILGDVLSATLGRVLKPQKAIRGSEWLAGGRPGLGIDGSMQQVQSPHGFFDFHEMRDAPPVPELGGASEVYARDKMTIESTFQSTMSRMSEQAGLRGFLMKNYGVLAGMQTQSNALTIESGDSTFSRQRAFWHMNVGDPSYTEFLRRYLNKDRNNYYNPLSNLAPSWLPEDNFYKDFHHGNYYNKVEMGEIRLSGAGYETLNPELRGLHPENYSLAHKYKILSGVAYGSDEWKFTKERVIQSLQAGDLSDREQKIVSEANEQLGDKAFKKSFRSYQFREQDWHTRDMTVTAVFDDGTFTTKEYGKRRMAVGGVNISMSALVRKQMEEFNISEVETANQRAEQARVRILKEMQSNLKVGQRITARLSASEADVFADGETKVYMSDLANRLVSLGGERDREDQFYSVDNFNQFQKGFGKAWETFTHKLIDLPVTPGLLLNRILPFQSQAKFIQRLDPIELYARTKVYGKDIQLWENYKESFIRPLVDETKSKIFGDFIPKKVQYSRMMNEYFDKLQWLKSFSLEQAAIQKGDREAARFHGKKKRETLFGADPYKGFTDIWKALPNSERDFYKEFINTNNPEDRERILELVPENLKQIYIAQWQNKEMTALRKKVDSGIASAQEQKDLMALYNMRRLEGMNYSDELDREYKNESGGSEMEYADWMRLKMMKEYFQTYKIPGANFVGFDPRVDLEDVKYKIAKQEGVDVHSVSMWEGKEALMPMKEAYVNPAARSLKGWSKSDGMRSEDVEMGLRKIMQDAHSKVSVTPLPEGFRNRVVVSGRDSREQEIKHKLKQNGFF